MGLDITAYTGLKPTDMKPEDFDWQYGHFKPGAAAEWAEENWPGRTAGLQTQTVYIYEDSFGFRAGSYSGYNAWREELAALTGTTAQKIWDQADPKGPFVELINFADNEGCIGPVVAAKLAKDFADFDEKAKTHCQDNSAWFYNHYQRWRKAFEMAAKNGAVKFH